MKSVTLRTMAVIPGLMLLPLINIPYPPAYLPEAVPKYPTDPGRLSLLQVDQREGGIVVNQSGGQVLNTDGVNIVEGRTPYRKAVQFTDKNRVLNISPEDGFDLEDGFIRSTSIAFWINNDSWTDGAEEWFFRLNIASSHNLDEEIQILKYGSNVYAGLRTNGVVVPKDIVLSLGPDLWHHMVLVLSNESPIKFYVDGELSISGLNYDGSVYPNYRGRCPDVCWGGWRGVSSADAVMEDMQTFDYPLPAAQVKEIYESTMPTTYYKIGNTPS